VNAIEKAGATGTLAADEKASLARLEEIVEHGIGHVYRVAKALEEIRDSRLYREHYRTFEDYCQHRWNYTRRRVNQLIGTAEVIADLAGDTMGTLGSHTEIMEVDNSSLPTTERQLRPLAALPSDKRKEVWREAVETSKGGRPSGRHVQSVVSKKLESAAATEPSPEPTDALGIRLEGKMIEVFEANKMFDDVMFHLRKAAKLMDELACIPGGEHLRHELSAKISGDKTIFRSLHLDNAKRQVDQSRPYAGLCGYCHHEHPGKVDPKCRACYGLGWNTESEWRRTPPDFCEAAVAAKKGSGK
jgi:hypothetical protein